MTDSCPKGLYHFTKDELQMASRITSSMVRQALELGLHRHGTLLRLSCEQTLINPLNTFWTIFIFDRQWSFAVGLPVVMQNNDIDPEVPEPVSRYQFRFSIYRSLKLSGTDPSSSQQSSAYLRAMIRYARIGDQAWESLSRSVSDRLSGSRIAQDFRGAYETLDYHQFQLDQWQKNIPEDLKFSYTDYTSMRKTMLRTILRLRANQMRIIMIRPFLFSSAGTEARLREAMSAIDVATDTIQVLMNMRAKSNLYRLQQPLFNHFLVAAIGMLYFFVIRHYVQASSSSTTSYRLSGPAFTTARTGLMQGLEILRALGCSATTPRSLWDKLFPVLSQLNRSEDKPPISSSSLPEALYRFPDTTYDTDLLNYQYDLNSNQSLLGAAPFPLNAASQGLSLDFDSEFLNAFDTESFLMPVNDGYGDKYAEQQFVGPSNGGSMAESQSDLHMGGPDNGRLDLTFLV